MSKDTLPQGFRTKVHINPTNVALEVVDAAGTTLMMYDLEWLATKLLNGTVFTHAEKAAAGAGLVHLLATLK